LASNKSDTINKKIVSRNNVSRAIPNADTAFVITFESIFRYEVVIAAQCGIINVVEQTNAFPRVVIYRVS
jgi:hypothetical protein